MSPRPNILCVGRLYCDVIFTDLPRMPTAGTEIYAGGVGLHAGGGAAITAGHLATLGHATCLAACLPKPPFGDVVLGELQRLDVDTSFCRASKSPCDPQVTVALVHDGERSFVTHRAGPAFPEFSLEDIRRAGISHVHIGEAATLAESPQLLDLAHSADATTSLDCSWDDHLDTDRIAGLLPGIDVFLPNEAELALLRARGVSLPLSKLTVIKKGKNGATALMPDRELHAAAAPSRIVDTTGAGDAFNAAFLSAWLAERPIEDCLAAGNKRGAEAIAHRGGLGGLSGSVSLQNVH